jgi:hypothetical protein
VIKDNVGKAFIGYLQPGDQTVGELITIQGDKLRTISGWEFKLIVGRVLGWNGEELSV